MTRTGWSYHFGEHPNRVTAYEAVTRGGVVYLHWRTADTRPGARAGARRDITRTTGLTLRDGRGRLLSERVDEAKARAKAKYHELIGLASGTAAPPKRALTIGDALARAFDPHRGKWPKDKPYRREMAHALTRACAVWGREQTWGALTKGDFRALWRSTFRALRAQGVRGHRATEVTVARVLTVAAWLREEDLIPPVAWLPWEHWRTELQEDIEEIGEQAIVVQQPRYTTEELRALLRTAKDVDPRWDLMLQLGAGLRLGQVARARRSCLTLETGLFDLRTVGRKHKKGAARLLTPGQVREFWRATAPGGYLHELERAYLEHGVDYPLFYGMALARKTRGRKSTTAASKAQRAPLSTGTLRDMLAANEFLAGVAHLPGRGWTGLRRVTVDLAKKERISRDALKELGGWADTQMADRIYADDDLRPAREEARDALARIREEPEDESP